MKIKLKNQMWVLEMKIEIGDKNKIKNSNIGVNNKIEKEDKGKNILIDILVGIVVGIAVYLITKYLIK